KRLFKGAERAGDDELMGVFLVAFDRCIRRKRKTVMRRKWDRLPTREEAEARQREWVNEGYESSDISTYSSGFGPNSLSTFSVYAQKQEEVIVALANTMPRPKDRSYRNPRTGDKLWKSSPPITDAYRERLEKRFILFSLPTRRYLRRRAWRYFRNLGRADGDRYRA